MIEQLIPRRKFRIQSKEFGNQWQTISYQKKASDVELEGGETVQHRIDNLVAKITELSTVIRNFKAQEGTDHDAFKRRIGLLYEQIRSGIGGVYNTFLTIEAEGEGAEDYNRLSGEFNTFQNQTRTKLTQLEADVEELLSYEPDAEGNVEQIDAYDYLDKLIDELEEYMSLVLTQLAQVIGDGDITDVLLNANVDITDQTDTSLAAALKIQHGKISGLETMMNQMGVGNPPYTWERYEYSSSDDPTTCPVKVTAMTNTGDTTTYVPVWRVVFFYQPVFKLLKMTGYMGVSGTGTLDRSVYLSMDVETNKLRFFYTLLDNYERYQWINQDENGVISTVLDQYIDPRQGLLRNGYDSTTVLRVEQWSGLSLPSYYNFNYLGISMGDTGDTAYNPSGFSVWDSGLPEKPEDPVYAPTVGSLIDTYFDDLYNDGINYNSGMTQNVKTFPVYLGTEYWDPSLNGLQSGSKDVYTLFFLIRENERVALIDGGVTFTIEVETPRLTSDVMKLQYTIPRYSVFEGAYNLKATELTSSSKTVTLGFFLPLIIYNRNQSSSTSIVSRDRAIEKNLSNYSKVYVYFLEAILSNNWSATEQYHTELRKRATNIEPRDVNSSWGFFDNYAYPFQGDETITISVSNSNIDLGSWDISLMQNRYI